MRAGKHKWEQEDESGGTGAGKQEQANANKGGGATTAVAATVGPHSPPFLFIYLVFLLSEWAAAVS